jgi:hypothetical protein
MRRVAAIIPMSPYVADEMDDLAAKAIIPLTTASAEIIDLPRQCAVAGGTAVWPYG